MKLFSTKTTTEQNGMSEHIVTFSSSTIKYNHLLNTDICYNIADAIYNQK